MNNNYTVFHLHSDLSSGVTNIDSITKYDEYVKYAASLGMKAMAFSEHGSVFEWVKKKESIEAAGMKYIHASEFYVTASLDGKLRDNKHCILIAKNYAGVLELNRLSSASFNRNDGHFYYVPRISYDELVSTSENIIISTACLGGILADELWIKRDELISFLSNNRNRCYLELQHHNVDDQKDFNKYLIKLHNKYGIPIIAATDTHALNAEQLEGRAMLQKAKGICFGEEDGWDLSFKTRAELEEAFRVQGVLSEELIQEAINNTDVMSNQIEEFTLDRSYKYPHLWDDPENLFIQKIKEGIIKRGVDKYPNKNDYIERIKYELKAYKHNGAIDFMLLMEDIISWCNKNDIHVGYGRGSVNGSIIAWLLGITEMDSIKYGLNFERFMNIERVSLSDIDTDFPPSRINDVKSYIFNHHGLYCSDIITFNTIADKGAIRDIGRALEIPLDEVGNICNAVDNEEKYRAIREQYPDLFKYVDLVKGSIISIGNHPCGMITSATSLNDAIGLCTTSTDDCPISQIYMKEIDGLNYVKLDLLKLDTIELINNTCDVAGIERCLPDNLDTSDIDVWNSMRDDTTCIFQWEGNTGNDYIKKLLSDNNIAKFKQINENVDRMTLLSIGNSAIRPAGASYRDDLANGVLRKSGSEAIDDFLKPTFGYLVFQCQIIEFLHYYCGFTMGEADIVRRHFAKKIGTDKDIPIIKDGGYLNEEHYIPGFIATMKERYGMDREEAERAIVGFLQVIIDASNYLFSLNHSQPYSFMGYACAWLRYYYPLEFLTCALNINKDKEEKTIAITKYAKSVNIKIRSPKFRYSKADYLSDKKTNSIYKGIGSIKNMNDRVANELYELRGNQYECFIHLLGDIKDKTSLDSRQLDILIKLNFFSEFGYIEELLQQVDMYGKLKGKKQLKLDKLPELGIPEWLVERYSNKMTEKVAKDFNWSELLKAWVDYADKPEKKIADHIRYELDLLGYIQTVMPKVNHNIYMVVGIKGESSKIFTLYQIKTGDTKTIKCRKKTWGPKPLELGTMIKIIETEDQKRWSKNQAGEWVRLDDTEEILTNYNIL